MSLKYLGIDTGGTFTDFVYLAEGQFIQHKVLSTPAAPEKAIARGIHGLGLTSAVRSGDIRIIHGTTVATNATLEGKGVATAYITNRGLGDVLHIGRQTRSALYDLNVTRPTPPIDSSLLFEVEARVDASGHVVQELSQDALKALKSSVEARNPGAIAINLLFSFLNEQQEREIEALFSDDFFVSRSSFVLPEYREYERGIATWLNGWLGPLIRDYLLSLQKLVAPGSLSIMQSTGITISADQAATRAVNLLLSGPAGGLSAARLSVPRNLMTFDMGGTSTDVSLISDDIRLTRENSVAQFPVAVPMADIHTIGAGGGSIAFIDQGGLLQVGPGSAGADPGPACYGQGGKLPTVTDANLVLGRLRPGAFMGGKMKLDPALAESSLAPLASTLGMNIYKTALGIIQIANEHMIQALRAISIQRGYDPQDFSLVCFGGAGGLHLCALADAMGMDKAVVPVMSGVLSALGMLVARPGRELTRTRKELIEHLNDDELAAMLDALEQQGAAELRSEGVDDFSVGYSLDLRYLGQTATINVPFRKGGDLASDFTEAHKKRYGHRLEKPIELVNLRVHLEADRDPVQLPALSSRAPGAPVEQVDLTGVGLEVPIFARSSLAQQQTIGGPALIIDDHATTLVAPDWTLRVDDAGHLRLHRIKGRNTRRNADRESGL